MPVELDLRRSGLCGRSSAGPHGRATTTHVHGRIHHGRHAMYSRVVWCRLRIVVSLRDMAHDHLVRIVGDVLSRRDRRWGLGRRHVPSTVVLSHRRRRRGILCVVAMVHHGHRRRGPVRRDLRSVTHHRGRRRRRVVVLLASRRKVASCCSVRVVRKSVGHGNHVVRTGSWRR